MSRKLRAIVVGAGVIGRVHVDALRLNNVEVASLIASSPARGREAAAELGVARWDPDLETALANTRADAVHIATPNVLHHGMAVAALEAGKHVICEKPLTNTTAEAADLHARTRGSDRVHAVCFNNRFYPLVQESPRDSAPATWAVSLRSARRSWMTGCGRAPMAAGGSTRPWAASRS